MKTSRRIQRPDKRYNQVYKDFIGRKFGDLTVIKLVESHRKPCLSRWLCQCFCGKQKTVQATSLTTGNTKSCGCGRGKKVIDLSGKRFGMLIAILRAENSKKQTRWLCKCDCGNEKVIFYTALVNGLSKSCGCGQGNVKHRMCGKPGYKRFYLRDPVKKIRHNVSTSVRSAITNRGGSKRGHSCFAHLPYTIGELKKHIESLWEPWMTWSNYGGKANDPRRTWQLDHIKPHSSFNYLSVSDKEFLECWDLSNLRPLEKIQNMSKGAKAA